MPDFPASSCRFEPVSLPPNDEIGEESPCKKATKNLIGMLISKNLTIAIAESLTGGLVVGELTRVPGASRAVRGGVVVYSTPMKHSLLGVSASLLEDHGPVHPDVALAMASGVRSAFAIEGVSADIGISTTGVAGPQWQGGHPPGTVFVGIETREKAQFFELNCGGSREEVRLKTVRYVVKKLLDVLDSLV